MLPSKFTTLFASILITSPFLVGCSMPKPQDRVDTPKENASFVIDQSSAEMTEQKLHAGFSLPVSKTFNFHVCVKEMQHSKPIINHQFEMELNGKTETLTSDRLGCLNWVETFEYNHLAKAQWVEVTRSIRARGLQKGQRPVSFALNPWEDLAHSLANKKIANLVQGETATDAFKAETFKGIWVDDVRMAIEERKITPEGTILSFEARSQPSFAVMKTANRQVLEPITAGQFEAELTFINVITENQKEVRRALMKPIRVQGKIVAQTLLLETEVKFPTNAKYGQIQLGLKISAVNGPEGMKPFHGVFQIGEYDQIKGTFFSRLKSFFQDANNPKTVEQYLTETSSEVLANTRSNSESPESGAYQKSRVQVTPLQFEHIGFQNDNGLAPTKVFSVGACFLGPVDSKPLRFQEFVIRKANGSTEKRQSNGEGCVKWEDSVNYQLLDQECWQPKQVQISNSNLGMNQTLSLNINPWAAGGSGFQDKRQIGDPIKRCATGPSRILLTSYTFEKRKIEYPIDSLLNIKMQKEGTLQLQARLKRPSLTHNTGFEETSLPPGKYLLRWAIVDAYASNLQDLAGKIYQTDEKWVQIDATGTLSESIRLESSNIKALGNTNLIYFELLPENQTANFQVSTYRGTITMANGRDNSSLEPLQASASSNQSTVQKLAEQKAADLKKRAELIARISTKQHLAHEQNFILVNLNNEQETSNLKQKLGITNTAQLQNALRLGKLLQEFGNRFCQHFFSDQPVLKQDCSVNGVKNPRTYFESQYRYFVKGATKVKDLGSEVRDLSVNNSFSLTRTTDVAEMTISGVSAGASIGIPKFSGIGGSLGGSVEYGFMFSNHEARTNTSSISAGETLISEKLNFLIRATGYEKCAVIRINEEIYQKSDSWALSKAVNYFKKSNPTPANKPKGLLICDGQSLDRSVTFTESYYILNQSRPGVLMADTTSDHGRPLFMAIRGALDYSRLLKLVGTKFSIPKEANSQDQADKAAVQSNLIPAFLLGIPSYPGQFLTVE